MVFVFFILSGKLYMAFGVWKRILLTKNEENIKGFNYYTPIIIKKKLYSH